MIDSRLVKTELETLVVTVDIYSLTLPQLREWQAKYAEPEDLNTVLEYTLPRIEAHKGDPDQLARLKRVARFCRRALKPHRTSNSGL